MFKKKYKGIFLLYRGWCDDSLKRIVEKNLTSLLNFQVNWDNITGLPAVPPLGEKETIYTFYEKEINKSINEVGTPQAICFTDTPRSCNPDYFTKYFNNLFKEIPVHFVSREALRKGWKYQK